MMAFEANHYNLAAKPGIDYWLVLVDPFWARNTLIAAQKAAVLGGGGATVHYLPYSILINITIWMESKSFAATFNDEPKQ